MSTQPSCHAHPGAAVAGACSSCTKALCAACLFFVRYQPVCAECARTLRARNTRSSLLLIASIAGAVVLVGGAVLTVLLFYEKPFQYGPHAEEYGLLNEHLTRVPCDETTIVALGELMVEAGNYKGAVQRSEQFFRACGGHPRLLWVTYGAYKRMGNHEAAVIEATKLIESEPSDKDYWWWRAVEQEKLGRLELAAQDYEKAIEVEPRLTSIPFNLAAVYEKLGRSCEAATVLERYVENHPSSQDQVQNRIDRLRRSGGCAKNVEL